MRYRCCDICILPSLKGEVLGPNISFWFLEVNRLDVPKWQNDSVHFQGKPFNIMVIQVYVLTSNAEEAQVEWFIEDLLDLIPRPPPKKIKDLA